jgi:hypothetical protein
MIALRILAAEVEVEPQKKIYDQWGHVKQRRE